MAIVLPKFSRRRSPTGRAAETQPAVNVALCREDATYVGDEMLCVKWRVSRVTLDELQAIEVSVLWHTEGKGDEDLNVQHFLRVDESQIRRAGLTDEQSLTCRLPATPLSYHGRLISIRWCARLRLFLSSGREIVTEQPFHLVTSEIAKRRRAELLVSMSDDHDAIDLDAISAASSIDRTASRNEAAKY